jgi:hypothetical protein
MLWRRQQQLPQGRHRLVVAAAPMGVEPSLVTLPVFPLPNVLHPTQQGVLTGLLAAAQYRGGRSGKCGLPLCGACPSSQAAHSPACPVHTSTCPLCSV